MYNFSSLYMSYNIVTMIVTAITPHHITVIVMIVILLKIKAVDLIYFHFHFYFYFSFVLFFIFLFLELRVRVRVMRSYSHKSHDSWKDVKGPRKNNIIQHC